MRNFGVFLDRDGVINYDPGHFHKITDLKIYPRVAQAIRLLNLHKIPAIVITNQSVVARGYITEAGVNEIHAKIKTVLAAEGATLNAIYYCPHHPDGTISKYKKICNCRKPETGLFELAAKEFNLAIEKSYIVGDSFREIEAAKRLGCSSIAVTCGSSDFRSSRANHQVANLYEAVKLILSNRLVDKG